MCVSHCLRDAWEEIIERCEGVGVDAFEINFSCPHGMPERRMGMAMGQDCELLSEVCGWINSKATVPVWGKMTPNITDITQPARTALEAGEPHHLCGRTLTGSPTKQLCWSKTAVAHHVCRLQTCMSSKYVASAPNLGDAAFDRPQTAALFDLKK